MCLLAIICAVKELSLCQQKSFHATETVGDKQRERLVEAKDMSLWNNKYMKS